MLLSPAIKISFIRQRNVLALNVIFFLSGHYGAYAQSITGDAFVCQKSVKSYTFTGVSANCQVFWSVTEGVFASNNSTSATTTTNASGKSTISVTWTGRGIGSLYVTANCIQSSGSMPSIVVEEIPLSVNATPSSINLGDVVTLTASSNQMPSYTWTTTSTGHLQSASGNPVTAKPIANSTYICHATRTFAHGVNNLTCTNSATVSVTVSVPPIQGNKVCCSQCILKGTTASSIGQSPNEQLSGGNGSAYTYQWQRSTNGTTFSGISGATGASYAPGGLNQTTWFRRMVSATGSPAVSSDIVVVEVAEATLSIAANNYTQNATVRASETISVQGNQTPAAGVTVEFKAGNQIIVNPSTILYPNITLRAGVECGTETLSRVAEAFTIANSADTVAVTTPTKDAERWDVFPNPAHGEATITYAVKERGPVSVMLVDAMGISVAALMPTQEIDPGNYSFQFSTHTLNPGLYFCIFESGNYRNVKRLSVISN